MTYKNPTPVVVALIRVEDGLLAVQRLLNPVGGWAFPGGFVDEGESAEVAVAREVLEETGLRLSPEYFWPITTRVTPRNQLLIFMLYEGHFFTRDNCHPAQLADLTNFVPNDEVSALKIVTEADELCFPLHTEVLHKPGLYM